MVVPHIIRMTCRAFGIDQAEQQSPQYRHHGNQQEHDKRDDRMFLHRPIMAEPAWPPA